MENVQLVHGSPRDEDEYILMASDAYEILQKCRCSANIFWAHACPALPFAGKQRPRQVFPAGLQISQRKQTARLEIKPKTTYMVNPGSVGQPRDNDPRAAFLLYDTDAALVTFYRVPYNIQRRTGKNLLPPACRSSLAIRLEEGR